MADIFPSFSGENLNKENKTIPDDYIEKNLIVIIAFQRWHQSLVDSSIDTLEKMGFGDTHYILQIPVIEKTTWSRKIRLDTIMRAGIRDHDIRARTITVYTNKPMFNDKFGIDSEVSIHWFVVGHISHEILLRGEGLISPEDISGIKSGSKRN